MFLSRMNEGVGDAIYEVGKDTVLGLKDLAGGAWEFSRLSDEQKVATTISTVLNTPSYTKIIWQNIADSWNDKMVNGDTYSRAPILLMRSEALLD